LTTFPALRHFFTLAPFLKCVLAYRTIFSIVLAYSSGPSLPVLNQFL